MDSRHDAQIKAEAFDWLVRIQDPDLDPEEPYPDLRSRWIAFRDWFGESPDHLRAFLGAVGVSNSLHQIDSQDAIDVGEILSNANSNVVHLTSGQAHTPPNSAPSVGIVGASTRRRTKRLPLLACAALMMLLILPLLLKSVDAWPTRYDTSIGQRIFVPLEDHSTMELNTRTHLEVAYGPHSREIKLFSGEAIFDVRHDPSRPFRVISGNTVIEDVGTKFAVYRHPDGTTTVTVLEGQVEITTGATTRTSLEKDDAATVLQGHLVPQIESLSVHEIRRRLSWEDGSLSFEGETLGQAITEVNRYNERQLVIEDPTVASRQIGGTFQAVDLDAFLEALQSLYDLRAVAASDGSNVIKLQRDGEIQ